MDVSIITISYNAKNEILALIKSVYEHTKGLEFEYFVVDNNSQDESAETVEKEFSQVKVIKNSYNAGFGATNNIAIRQAKGKYVFLLNQDTLLVENTIKKFFDFMENKKNQKIGICGTLLYTKEMQLQHCCGPLPSLYTALISNDDFLFKPNLYLHNLHMSLRRETKSRRGNLSSELSSLGGNDYLEVDYVTGADFFVRKSILDEVGLFDEDFFLYYEETELTFRIRKKGYKSVINTTSQIIHYGGTAKKMNIPARRAPPWR